MEMIEYQCISDLNIYDSPECVRLATQAARGRNLTIPWEGQIQDTCVEVCLCEDQYRGWIDPNDLRLLKLATKPYQPANFTAIEIEKLVPDVIEFSQKAMGQTNYYLWGGTVGPNYDCSGLMQAAFLSVGVWIPRDAYQQEAFTQTIDINEIQIGDLVFFGTPQKATHVGLYLGNGYYIHSSGKDQGRNGIGIDQLSPDGDRISQLYYEQLRGSGRVVRSYTPIPQEW
ncbi:NLP/P60 protein [Raphidiopsis curvata NIES-932]|nr:NLP/P60 protein [Raphidiopsis curvata NIES-932]